MIYKAPVNDMMFLAEDWLGLERLRALPGHEELDADMLRFILEEAGKFCAAELLPINRGGDEHGAVHEDGQVRTPPGFRAAYQKFVEGGWTGVDASPEHGGQGLPKLVQFLVDEMVAGCNPAFKLYAELTHGAYHLMESCAPENLKALYLPPMVEGRWSGTMCLTEPQAGTDLGLLSTRAEAQPDGSYRITGSKIFITSGDHDLTENILHMVLARTRGAPEGSRGISLFLVPRILVNADGSVGERNGVVTGSIEHKMGIRASATCALNFDAATGYLLGEENHGLAAMFHMMNMERITVGIQGLGMAELAYQNAVAYALERRQSRAPKPRPDPGRPADAIIHQPEIRRMLMRIRAQVEGGRALAAYTGMQVDIAEGARAEGERQRAAGEVALLTPVIKAFLSDMGLECTLVAQQVFGGHGYIAEHGMEQLVRDVRITSIYEGTNEVQALDLVSRKLGLDGGRVVDEFLSGWQRRLAGHAGSGDEALAGLLEPASQALERLVEITETLRARLRDDEAAARGAASDFLRVFALTMLACLWADLAALAAGGGSRFHAAKLRTARFYMDHVLPETAALRAVIRAGADALAGVPVEDFET